MKPFRLLLIGATLAGATLWAAEPLRLDAQPTFTGIAPDTAVVTVTLENDGPDARGVLRVSGQAAPMSYPIELPRGARKRLLTLPDADWGVVDFTLQTDQGTVEHHMPAMRVAQEMAGSIALIGDDVGGLAFLRKQTVGKRNLTARDAYVKPEDAPGRPVAYRGFNAVVLGPGAERVGDGAAAALREYALGGGSVVFLGGASAPLLEDPRWASILPGRDWRPQTRMESAALAKVGGFAPPGPFTVLVPGALARGAIRSGDEFERGYGLGRIVVLGYTPLDAPLSAWGGRAKAMARFVRGDDSARARMLVNDCLNPGANGDVVSMSTSGVVRRTSTALPAYSSALRYGSSTVDDPFSVKLPKASSVFGILALYFVLVVPVSFLVLRRMKRGELAWVTAPLLALGFAAILFKSAQSLYAAALSTASQGLLVLQEGAPSAMFYGTSQVFFPRGGVYDLHLENADTMTGVRRNEYYGFGSPPNAEGLEGFNLVDAGTVRAPRLEANNLAFRELSYSQRVEPGEGFRSERVDARHVKILNRTPWAFNGRIADGGFSGPQFSLEPGASKVVELGVGDRLDNEDRLLPRDPRNFTRGNGRIVLGGTLKGFRPGPQIGSEVEKRSGVSVLAFAEETVR